MNQRIISQSKEEAKKRLQNKVTSLQRELEKAQKDLEYIDDYIVITPSMMDKSFTKLSLNEKNTICKTNPKVWEWFVKNEEEPYSQKTTNPNKMKTLQDYIDEGEPVGKLNFYEV